MANSKAKITKSTIVSKKILIDRISTNLVKKRLNLTKPQIEAVLNEYLETTKQALVKGEEIRLQGYYSFKTTTQKARIAMNLKTKKKMTVPAKRVPKVKFSTDLKEAIAEKK